MSESRDPHSPDDSPTPVSGPAATAPIDVVAAVRAAASPKASQRAWGWWALAGVGVFISIVLAAGVVQVVTGPRPLVSGPGNGSARPLVASPATPSPEHQMPASGAEWTAVVAALDDARAAAFARADSTLLAGVDAPDSPAYRADAAVVTALRTHRVRADGFVLDVARVQPRRATSDMAELIVTDSRPAFDWRTSTGAVVARAPARAASTWLVEISRGGALGWQVVSVRSAPTPAVRPPVSPKSSDRQR